jgi:hypothetical protein
MQAAEWRARSASVAALGFELDRAAFRDLPVIQLEPRDLVEHDRPMPATWNETARRFDLPPSEGYATASLVYAALGDGDEVTVFGRVRGASLEPFAMHPDEAPALGVQAGHVSRADLDSRLSRDARGTTLLHVLATILMLVAAGGVGWTFEAAGSFGFVPLFIYEWTGRLLFFGLLLLGVVSSILLLVLVNEGVGEIGIGIAVAAIAAVVLAARFLPAEGTYDTLM